MGVSLDIVSSGDLSLNTNGKKVSCQSSSLMKVARMIELYAAVVDAIQESCEAGTVMTNFIYGTIFKTICSMRKK